MVYYQKPKTESEIKNLMKVCFFITSSLLYSYFISFNIPKGKFRLLSLIPIIFLFTLIPLFFSYLFPVAISSLFISWLANFKLLLFAFDHGPLASLNGRVARNPSSVRRDSGSNFKEYHRLKKNRSLIQFISKTILPIKINSQNSYPPRETNPKLILNWPTKVLLFAISICVHDYYMKHKNLVLVLYACMSYLLVDLIFGVFNHLTHVVLNVELERPSDEPYVSSFLQDFWGRRWNLMVTNSLRHTVYLPVRSSLGRVMGQWAALPALWASFLVSGLMHELLFYHITRVTPTWEVTAFFMLHGLCLVVELGLKRLFVAKVRLHWMVSGPFTVAFVIVTAIWLFFPPVVRTGAANKALEECKMILHLVKAFVSTPALFFERLVYVY